MNYTKNYKLSKPSYDDDVDIQILNNNMDILDDNLKHTNDKFSKYLPLIGGTMEGDINLPNEVSLRDGNAAIKFIVQNELKTIRLEGERLSFNTPDNKHFKVDSTGIWYDDNVVLRDTGTSLGVSGFTKLSNGLILQWGKFSDLAQFGVVTFSTPFTNGDNITITVTDIADGFNRDAITYFTCFNINTTSFNIVGQNRQGSYNNLWGRWMAIGY